MAGPDKTARQNESLPASPPIAPFLQVVGGIRAGKLARPAYEILQRQYIDMVHLDLSMPLVSRHDVLQELHTANTSAKIIAGNWYATDSDKIAGVAD